jgi:DNA-binding CsgD family transcriptional regulator
VPPVPLRVNAATTLVLREAHYKISAQFAVGGDPKHYELFDYVRTVARKLTPFDAFYVGLLHGADRLRFPYGYEGGAYDDPSSHTFGPDSPAAWVISHRHTYRFAYDNGAVLQNGIMFGDVRRASADAVTVPLFRFEGERQGRVFGMLSMHSYTPGTFDDNTVRAFEWLADRVARVLNREVEDRDALLLLPAGDDAEPQPLTSDHVVDYLAARVAGLRALAEQADAELDGLPGPGSEPGGPAIAHDALRRIVTGCEQMQSELVEMALRTDPGPEHRFLSLTPAEQGLAVLLVDGLSNQQIGTELGITANTVKTHLRNICRKYGMGNRAQIAADVRRHLAR